MLDQGRRVALDAVRRSGGPGPRRSKRRGGNCHPPTPSSRPGAPTRFVLECLIGIVKPEGQPQRRASSSGNSRQPAQIESLAVSDDARWGKVRLLTYSSVVTIRRRGITRGSRLHQLVHAWLSTTGRCYCNRVTVLRRVVRCD